MMRRARSKVEMLPVPDKVSLTPELRAWLDAKGWTDADLEDAAETWRLKRKAWGVKHTAEQWIADLMYFLKTYREIRSTRR